MKKTAIIFFLILSIFPIYKIHAQSSNAGFVPANIWYSKDPFEEGDKIKIYTLIFNPDSREFSGTVNFFDQTVFLGKKTFAIPANGVQTIFIDWTATLGNHTIFGKIENAQFLGTNGKYEGVYLSQNETAKSSRTVSVKIIPQNSSTNATSNGTTDNSSGAIQNIANLIKDKTPDFIATPITVATNAIDGMRQNLGTQSDIKKTQIQTEITALDKSTNTPTKTAANTFLKPFDYVQLFFYTIAGFLFNNKFAFYGILIVLIFFFFRFLWRLIF